MVLEEENKNNTHSKTADNKILNLRIIKNRLGNCHHETPSIDFTFHGKYSCFEENKNKQKKSNKQTSIKK
jgi:hypothetical protein